MAEIKKFMDVQALGTLVDQIKSEDAKVLAAAKKYTDEAPFDAAGSSATAEANAKAHAEAKVKELADGAVKANTEAIAKLNGEGEGSVKKAVADAKATIDADVDAVEAIANQNNTDIAAINNETTGILAQAKKYADDEDAKVEELVAGVAEEVEEVRTYVGTIPSGATATDIVGYVQEKTAGIATDAALGELQAAVDEVEADVATIMGDYLKSSDKTELEGKITAEETRATGVESGLDSRIKAIEDDYLVEADKTELQGKIDAKADKTALDAVSAVANAAATKTALQEEVNRATGEEARIEALVTAEAERAAGVEESLQNQINTIMNNPDTEGVINSINEFTQYIADHGEIAEGFRTDIDANAQAIEDLSAEVAATYETKEDATTKYDEVIAQIEEKAVQADWNQNDETAPDYIKNRTHYEVNEYKVILEETEVATTIDEWGCCRSDNIRDKFTDYPTIYVANFKNSNWLVIFNGVEYRCTFGMLYKDTYGAGDGKIASDSCVTIDKVPFCISNVSSIGDAVLFTTEPGTYTLKVIDLDTATSSVKQLDEKYIPDTIARVSDLTDATGRVEVLEGEMDAVQTAVATKAEAQDFTNAIETLRSADEVLSGRLDAVEAQLGDGENSVSDLIADAEQRAKDAAATDAANKDVVVLSEAQGYADELNTAMDERVAAVEAASATHALKSEVEAVAGDVTTLEGKVDTLETEMDAVQALADAADKAAKANAQALALKASQEDLDSAVERIAKNEGDIVTINEALADKAEQEALEAAIERIAKNETDIAANTSAINSFTPITSAEVEALFA